jgi:PAS domain S-box-containing protein
MIKSENQIQEDTTMCGLIDQPVIKENPELDNIDASATEENRLLFHKLSLQQNELEMHNEELHRIQVALENERSRYFELFDNAPVGYCTISDEGLIVDANFTFASLLGVSRELLINESIRPFVLIDDQSLFDAHHQNNHRFRDPQGCELRMLKRDGTAFWVHLVTIAARNSGGKQECRLAISDITDRKQAEDALIKSEQRANDAKNLLKLVLDTVPVRLFWKDLSSTYLGCNENFARDAGFEVPEELIGLNDADMKWKEQADVYRRDDLEIMNSGKAKLHSEEMLIGPDGKKTWRCVSKVPLRSADDTIIGVLGTYYDITRRKWAEEELLKNEKLESLGLLAGGIAHAFNNVLMVIMGNVSLAKALLSPTDKAYERLARAEESEVKAKELTRQFLAFAKEGVPNKRPVSVSNLIMNYCRYALKDSKSMCKCIIPKDLWNMEADEGQLGHVMTNILINADQAMPDGGIITIRCENALVGEDDGLPLSKGNYIKIAFQDQGKGIPQEYLGKVFDPYFTTKETGRGLGLAAAYSIVKKHDGHIAVESSPESGTIFTLFLPASLSLIAAAPKMEIESRSGQGKILVMDDDELLLNVIATMLERLGYTAQSALNGTEAIEKYVEAQQSGEPFDAVIMDLIVPDGMGGREATEKLLAIDPHAKIIVSSGDSNNEVMSDYTRFGFSGVIAKPYRVAELSEMLQHVLQAGDLSNQHEKAQTV